MNFDINIPASLQNNITETNLADKLMHDSLISMLREIYHFHNSLFKHVKNAAQYIQDKTISAMLTISGNDIADQIQHLNYMHIDNICLRDYEFVNSTNINEAEEENSDSKYYLHEVLPTHYNDYYCLLKLTTLFKYDYLTHVAKDMLDTIEKIQKSI